VAPSFTRISFTTPPSGCSTTWRSDSTFSLPCATMAPEIEAKADQPPTPTTRATSVRTPSQRWRAADQRRATSRRSSIPLVIGLVPACGRGGGGGGAGPGAGDPALRRLGAGRRPGCGVRPVLGQTLMVGRGLAQGVVLRAEGARLPALHHQKKVAGGDGA